MLEPLKKAKSQEGSINNLKRKELSNEMEQQKSTNRLKTDANGIFHQEIQDTS